MTASVPYGNYTAFGMHSDAERYFWASYHIFVLLSSLIGDSLILVASLQKDTIKVNKFIVTEACSCHWLVSVCDFLINERMLLDICLASNFVIPNLREPVRDLKII